VKDTLYYDGRCDLCLREIRQLQRLSNEQLELRDIHTLPAEGGLPTREALLRTLHLRRAGGEWLTGLDASVAAWQHTRLGALWRWLRWPLIRPLATHVYRHWARWRYRRLYSCEATGRCES
jgi:predicted DCC family thiol-disulfide oxidoreductase YuxK